MEEKTISKILKYTFLTSGSAALIFGITFLFFIEIYLDIVQWPYYAPLLARILGAALLSLWLLQWLSYKETKWETVKNIVTMMIFWHLLGFIVTLTYQFLYNLPMANWIHISVFFVFLIAYVYSYYVENK
ncbi:MAG: hypothetical protein ACFFAO_03580 [Candidatus Hermodarchaeota archaeon]